MAENVSADKVYIGPKEIPKYLSACFYALGQTDEITLIARGNNVKGAIDVTAILIREYLTNPEYNVQIGSEKYGDRYVSTVEIKVKGTRKDADIRHLQQKDKISES